MVQAHLQGRQIFYGWNINALNFPKIRQKAALQKMTAVLFTDFSILTIENKEYRPLNKDTRIVQGVSFLLMPDFDLNIDMRRGCMMCLFSPLKIAQLSFKQI